MNGYIEESRELVVNGSYLKTDATIGRQNCRLKAIWYLTRSTGNGLISFSEEQSAIDGYRVFKRLDYQCHYERSTNVPTLKVIYYLNDHIGRAYVNFETTEQAMRAILKMNSPETVKSAHDKYNRAAGIVFQNFPKDFDEEDVRAHFQDCKGIVDVQVVRGRRGQLFQIPQSAEDDITSIFSRYKSFQVDTITINSKIINGKLEAYVEFLDKNELQEAIEDLDGEMGVLGYGKVRLSERILQKKTDTRKKKENEYVIRFHSLNLSYDKYDLIKILKENRLYKDVKNVIVFRQKLEKETSSYPWSRDITSQDQETGLVNLRSMFVDTEDLFHSIPDCQISSTTPNGTVTALVLFNDPADVLTAVQTYDNRQIELSTRTSKLRLIPSMTYEIFINAALTKVISEKIEQVIQCIRERFKRVYIKSISSKKNEKAVTTKIFIDGDDIEQVTMAKIEFDNLMKGMEYKFEDDSEKVSIVLLISLLIFNL